MRREDIYKGGLAEKMATHDLVVSRSSDQINQARIDIDRILENISLLQKKITFLVPREAKNAAFVNSADFASEVPFSMNFPEITFNQKAPND